MFKATFYYFVFACFILSCGTAGKAISSNNQEQTRSINAPAANMNLYPGVILNYYFPEDNSFELKDEDLPQIDAIADYLKANPAQSVQVKIYQHIDEVKETGGKRADFIKNRMVQRGASNSHVLVKIERPVLPQDTSDIFTPEELVNARRAVLTIIR